MQRITEPATFQRCCADLRAAGKQVALVPTMGALHAGHAALIQAAGQRADAVLVSVFVNPAQFGPDEDFARYPRSLEADAACCEALGVRGLFAPTVTAMYPLGHVTRVEVTGRLAQCFEGQARPGHFAGVATVVLKLLLLAGECTAWFGKKDAQQWQVIRRLVGDLHLPVRLEAHPIVRDNDGVALSSRNRFLNAAERAAARSIPQALAAAAAAWQQGERCGAALQDVTRTHLHPTLAVDYVAVVAERDFAPRAGAAQVGDWLLLAVRAGAVRLLDNWQLGVDPPPAPTSARATQAAFRPPRHPHA
ncbi:MAG: pantoate--beta-alanine ligase [Polyangiales bacterium]